MYRTIILAVALSVVILPETQAQTKADDKANTPKITITKLEVNDKNLKLDYEIRNNSGQDIWILLGFGITDASVDVFMDKDERTLLMRRRFDVPFSIGGDIASGRYVVMRNGETQIESISLVLPVHPKYEFASNQKIQGLEYATRLAFEIGYYMGDLPEMVRRIIEEDEKNPRKIPPTDGYYPDTVSGWFGGLVGFNKLNELLRSRDNEVLIPYTERAFTGERILHVTVDNLHIPYTEKEDRSEPLPPDLTPSTRVEIMYKPSMLEYFFPYAEEKMLLSPSEKKLLHTGKTIVVEDPSDIKALASDVKNMKRAAVNVCQKTVANVTCYKNDDIILSFPIYNNYYVVAKGNYKFRNPNEFRSLSLITPYIYQIDLRVKCAANLKHLWNRFRLYRKVTKSGFLRRRKNLYPVPKKWCDSILGIYRVTKKSDQYFSKQYKCPGSDHGKCHYAMNPNCKVDSPSDMVLLFETKAGWNQHGGSELFTFDNHEPKGGCVLLNDGTVKFIRTKEEIQQLRWK
ncbi:MAG: hypothetical protein H8D56_15785 [Planctomycetes bacterium]|nr:hypothetical protein [Planctomycetota bacterium]MBL7146374.1 hypothetical protein [Phycisphaerae bacterium]